MSKTNQNQCSTDQSKYTQVNTVYARACIILLAVNFCLTGYVLTGVMKIQNEQADSSSTPQPPASTLSVSSQPIRDVTGLEDVVGAEALLEAAPEKE